MGEWSPQEAVDFLVDRVGHERENATAEVRRSFRGDYGPLYQAAYLLGGIQIRALYRELVESKRMTAKAFHDEMLRQNSMPIALLRLAVGTQTAHAGDAARLEVLRGAAVRFRVLVQGSKFRVHEVQGSGFSLQARRTQNLNREPREP